jgi:hypothetical protein
VAVASHPATRVSACPDPVLRELPAACLNEALSIAFGDGFRIHAAQGRRNNVAFAAGP